MMIIIIIMIIYFGFKIQGRVIIGHFYDGVIWLQLPEFISFSFSNSNFIIPVESKEQ